MKKIVCLVIFAILVLGYILPVPEIRQPVDKFISSASEQMKSWGWFFNEKKCKTALEDRQKGYCADK